MTEKIVILKYRWNDAEVTEEEYLVLNEAWKESCKKDPPPIVAPEKKSRKTKK